MKSNIHCGKIKELKKCETKESNCKCLTCISKLLLPLFESFAEEALLYTRWRSWIRVFVFVCRVGHIQILLIPAVSNGDE